MTKWLGSFETAFRQKISRCVPLHVFAADQRNENFPYSTRNEVIHTVKHDRYVAGVRPLNLINLSEIAVAIERQPFDSFQPFKTLNALMG